MSEEFEITSDEVKKLEEALKKEEFRKLLVEYANEISDPENRKRYEDEITQMERERGYDVKFLNPTPGFVVKTKFKDGGKKVFINIATNSEIKPATPGPLQKLPNGEVGKTWSIPYSLVPAKEGVDAKKQKYTIYDSIFSPDTYAQGMNNSKFKELMVTTALDGIEKQFQAILERSNLKYPKSKYKGVPNPTVIRKTNESEVEGFEEKVESDPIRKLICSDIPAEKSVPKSDSTLPEYTVKYRGYFDMQDYTVDPQGTKGVPKETVVSITLPKLESIKDLKLDVKERELNLFHNFPRYQLNIPFSYNVDFNKAQAKFVQDIKQLIVELPIVHKIQPTPPPREIPPTLVDEEEIGTKLGEDKQDYSGDEETENLQRKVELMLSEKVSQSNNNDSDDVMSDDDLGGETGEKNKKKQIKNETDTLASVVAQQSVSSDSNPAPKQPGDLPTLQYKQTFKQFYFSFTLPDIIPSTISTLYRSNEVDLSFEDDSLFYKVSIRLPTECTINAQTSTCKLSENGVLLKIGKLGSGNKMWDTFRIGCGDGKMVEKRFLTESNILREVEEFGDPWSEESSNPPLTIKVSQDEAPLQVYLDMKHSEQSFAKNEEQRKCQPGEISSDNLTPGTPSPPSESREDEQVTSETGVAELSTGLCNDLIYELND